MPKLLFSLLIGHTIAFSLIFCFTFAKLDWSIDPDISVGIVFLKNQHNFIILSIFPTIGILFSVWIAKITNNCDWRALGILVAKQPINRILKLSILTFSILVIWENTWYAVSGFEGDRELINSSVETIHPIWRGGYLLWLVIIVPFVEELLFRGIIFSALTELVGVNFGLVCQAVLYALAHNELEALPVLFISGFAFGWLYHKTGMLLPSITVHASHAFLFVMIF